VTRPPATGRETERRRARPWVPRLAGLLSLFVGLMDVASAVSPPVLRRVREVAELLPGILSTTANAATLVIGILLVLLAHALSRRKRRAWRAVVGLLGFSVATHVVRGLNVEEAFASAALLVVLLLLRQEFYAQGDPRTRWRALWVFLGLAVADVGLGLAIVSVRPRQLLGSPSLAERLSHVLQGLVGVTGPLRFHSPRVAEVVSTSLLALGLLTLLVTAYLVLRPPEPAPHLSAEDETAMRALLAAHGWRDSLGYFALRRDKSVLWSPTRKSAIAYRVVSGVMLASGDPLGDPEAWPGAIAEFCAQADRHAWVPAVMGCSELGGQVWVREAGLQALEIGDEAVVEVAEFSLEGRAMRNVRQMVHRVERAGYACQVRRLRDIPPAERDTLRRQAAAWRHSETERGFSMALGRFGDPADGDCVAVTAVHQETLRGLLHFVPWGEDGLSLDLMRRDAAAEPGLNELLIVAALRQAPELGVRRLSLNFAAFRSAFERGERLGAGPVVRAWRRVLLFLSRWFQIESLYRFNAKFQPRWQPRFVVYPDAGDLPRIAVAALEAEAFLVVPSLLRRRRRRTDREPSDLAPV